MEMMMTLRNVQMSSLLLTLGIVGACADDPAPKPVGDGPRFLQACLAGGACGLGLECVCGVCTRPCNTANTCQDETANATCNLVGTPNDACVSTRASRACDVNCTVNDDCRSLGSAYTCESGSCRELSAGTCVHQGRIYADHTTFMNNGNHCTCRDGTATCDARLGADGGMDAMTNPVVSIPEPPCTGGETDAGLDTDAGGPVLTSLVPPPVCAEALTAMQHPGVELVATGPMASTTGGGPWGTGSTGFAVSDSDVYWISPDSASFTSPARIVRASRTQAGLWSVGSIGDALTLHVDGCRVYWIEREFYKPPSPSGAHVYSSQIDQFEPYALTEFGFYNHIGIPLALDAAHIYFRAGSVRVDGTYGSGLSRIARGGGTPEVLDPLTDFTSVIAFALRSDRVLLAGLMRPFSSLSDGVLLSISKDRTQPTEMLASGLSNPIAIAADDTHVYIANDAAEAPYTGERVSDPNLVRVPIGGGEPTLLREALVTSIAPYAERLYWMEYGGTGTERELWSAPKSDLSRAARIAEHVNAFHVGNGEVHWLGTCSTEQTSFVMRISTSDL